MASGAKLLCQERVLAVHGWRLDLRAPWPFTPEMGHGATSEGGIVALGGPGSRSVNIVSAAVACGLRSGQWPGVRGSWLAAPTTDCPNPLVDAPSSLQIMNVTDATRLAEGPWRPEFLGVSSCARHAQRKLEKRTRKISRHKTARRSSCSGAARRAGSPSVSRRPLRATPAACWQARVRTD